MGSVQHRSPSSAPEQKHRGGGAMGGTAQRGDAVTVVLDAREYASLSKIQHEVVRPVPDRKEVEREPA